MLQAHDRFSKWRTNIRDSGQAVLEDCTHLFHCKVRSDCAEVYTDGILLEAGNVPQCGVGFGCTSAMARETA